MAIPKRPEWATQRRIRRFDDQGAAGPRKRKRPGHKLSDYRERVEQDIDNLTAQLMDRHQDKYPDRVYLWAHRLRAKTWFTFDSPPENVAGSIAGTKRRTSSSERMLGTLIERLLPSPHPGPSSPQVQCAHAAGEEPVRHDNQMDCLQKSGPQRCSTPTPAPASHVLPPFASDMTPRSKARLRTEYYTQLTTCSSLYREGILSEAEYTAEKNG